jgi:acyl-CoA thioesterase
VRASDRTWKAEVLPDWDIFGISNGGYLMAIAARAMSEAGDGRLPVSVTAHFTRPVSAGAVTIDVDTVKVGKSLSTMRAVLSTEREALTLLGTLATPESVRDEVIYSSAEPPEMPPPEDCVRALPGVNTPLPPPLMAQFEERIHPEDASALEGKPTGVARVRGWFRLHDDEPLDAFAPLLVADAFPPAIFNSGLPLSWTPTVEMTTQIRSVPSTEWLRCRFVTRFVTGGLLEEDGEIWDENGRLVALSRQLALVPR